MHAHLLFLFSLCFSNHNDAIPDYNNKNETDSGPDYDYDDEPEQAD